MSTSVTLVRLRHVSARLQGPIDPEDAAPPWSAGGSVRSPLRTARSAGGSRTVGRVRRYRPRSSSSTSAALARLAAVSPSLASAPYSQPIVNSRKCPSRKWSP